MCADLTKKSGGMALFNGADHQEKGLNTICTPVPEENLPIAPRLAGFSPWHATFARTIYIVLGSLSWLTRVLSTLPIPSWLDLVPVPVTVRSTSLYRLPLYTKRFRKSGFRALCGGRGQSGVTFHASAAECTAPHSPSRVSALIRLPL
jgi:hypothetical protein